MRATICAKCGAALKSMDEFCTACGAAASALEASAAAMEAAPRAPITDPLELEQLRAATLGYYDILGEILGELGRGGMATVCLAHEIALDRKVAIKVMSPVLATGDGIERFKREARTAASLSHPNIIPIYAVRHSAQLLYFVMKYVEGGGRCADRRLRGGVRPPYPGDAGARGHRFYRDRGARGPASVAGSV